MAVRYVYLVRFHFYQCLPKKNPQKTKKKQLVNVVKQYGGVDVQETIKQKLAGQFR